MEPRSGGLLTFGGSSGNPARTKRGCEDTAHYVIVTATMDMLEARQVDAQMQSLKAKYFAGANPDRVSFHGYQLLNRLSRHDPGAKKRFGEVFDDVMGITKNMDAAINAVVMDKGLPDESHRTSSTVIASWAQASAMTRNTLLGTSRKAVSMTMLDRYGDSTNRVVARTMAKFLGPPMDPAKPHSVMGIPRPVFVVAESCPVLQLVDMLAYIVSKNYKGGGSGVFGRLYSQLEPHMSHISHITA